MSAKYKPQATSSLFPEEFRLEKLSKQGDPLEHLNNVVNWEYFRTTIEKMVKNEKMVNAGPKPYDPLLMFKILVLQRYYNLGDHQIEFQILDRLTFCRFLGLSLNDRVPDEKTVWLFRERLIKKGLDKELFKLFNTLLEKNGLIAHEGKIIDASFVDASRQRNSREENKQIKENQIPEKWDKTPNKKRQKDVEAKWTKKNNETHYGYKNHAKVDNKHKFVDKYTTTDDSVHDSQALDDLLDEKDEGKTFGQTVPILVRNKKLSSKNTRLITESMKKGIGTSP